MDSRRRAVLVGVSLVVIAGVVVAGVVGIRKLWDAVHSHYTPEQCTVGSYTIDTEQAAVAAQMLGAVRTFRVTLPARAGVLVLAAALQESKLTNIPPGEGDRDSVGVLQQRPSQGWGHGHASELTNVTEATTEFLQKLIDVKHWQTLPLAEAVQDVQISADGSLYAQHEPQAQALADALSGRKPAAITCEFPTPTTVAGAAVVAQQVRTQLGIGPVAASGRRVRAGGASWQTAAWFVANADRLGIDTVAYDKHTWTPAKGWQRSRASAAAVVATLHDLGTKG